MDGKPQKPLVTVMIDPVQTRTYRRGAPLPCETFSVPQAVRKKFFARTCVQGTVAGRPYAQYSIRWFRRGLRLVAELNAQFAESATLEQAIQANLRGLGYGS
jgi:hypothetical protein